MSHMHELADGNSTSSMPIMCLTSEHIPDP